MKKVIWYTGVFCEILGIAMVFVSVAEKMPFILACGIIWYVIGRIVTDIYGSNYRP